MKISYTLLPLLLLYLTQHDMVLRRQHINFPIDLYLIKYAGQMSPLSEQLFCALFHP